MVAFIIWLGLNMGALLLLVIAYSSRPRRSPRACPRCGKEMQTGPAPYLVCMQSECHGQQNSKR